MKTSWRPLPWWAAAWRAWQQHEFWGEQERTGWLGKPRSSTGQGVFSLHGYNPNGSGRNVHKLRSKTTSDMKVLSFPDFQLSNICVRRSFCRGGKHIANKQAWNLEFTNWVPSNPTHGLSGGRFQVPCLGLRVIVCKLAEGGLLQNGCSRFHIINVQLAWDGVTRE